MAKRKIHQEDDDESGKIQGEDDNESGFVLISVEQGASPHRQSNRRVHRFANSRHQGMLNSSLFDCYMRNLWRNFPEDKVLDFTYLDCLWFSLYTEESYKGKLRCNTIRSHWNLLIICNFGGSSQLEPITSCMLLLDSLRMADDPMRLEPLIRKFAVDIYEAEAMPENTTLVSQIPILVPKVPQQRNETDCGYFVLYYISLFVNNAPENFRITEGYPYFMKEDWFGLEDFNSFRDKLKSDSG
ncbi:ubiquitin-like-specific protease 1D isoform X2 [Mangifera indica]|uniref:ubiquitin-like-specific protease 1D isoform X2 n=1 Tax=Mangifera indica TaxID=29780 RepID=UPI001CFBE90E|nr:ubiquitin-like-specific protease 1D isoform X2 [Mangifera indica]